MDRTKHSTPCFTPVSLPSTGTVSKMKDIVLTISENRDWILRNGCRCIKTVLFNQRTSIWFSSSGKCLKPPFLPYILYVLKELFLLFPEVSDSILYFLVTGPRPLATRMWSSPVWSFFQEGDKMDNSIQLSNSSISTLTLFGKFTTMSVRPFTSLR